MVKHIFDRLLSFPEPPEIHTVEGLSAVGTDRRQKCRLCSQTTRAPSCATPGFIEYIQYSIPDGELQARFSESSETFRVREQSNPYLQFTDRLLPHSMV